MNNRNDLPTNDELLSTMLGKNQYCELLDALDPSHNEIPAENDTITAEMTTLLLATPATIRTPNKILYNMTSLEKFEFALHNKNTFLVEQTWYHTELKSSLQSLCKTHPQDAVNLLIKVMRYCTNKHQKFLNLYLTNITDEITLESALKTANEEIAQKKLNTSIKLSALENRLNILRTASTTSTVVEPKNTQTLNKNKYNYSFLSMLSDNNMEKLKYNIANYSNSEKLKISPTLFFNDTNNATDHSNTNKKLKTESSATDPHNSNTVMSINNLLNPMN